MCKRVLVADDSSMMRKIILRALGNLDLDEIAEAADGRDALRLFAEGDFDLVLTDWNMPKKTGLDVVRAIRASGSEIPVVVVATEAEIAAADEALQAGANEVLAKPFEGQELRTVINQLSVVS